MIIRILKKLIILYKDINLKKIYARIMTNEKIGSNHEIQFFDQHAHPDKSKISKSYQLINDPIAAKRFGASDIQEYSYWSWRACAVACIYMILKQKGVFEGTMMDLIYKLNSDQGYEKSHDRGWKHQALIELLREYGLESNLYKYLSQKDIIRAISQNHLVLASIKSRSQKTGSHMIIIKNFIYREDNIYIGIIDPYNLDDKGGKKQITQEMFIEIFNYKGIVVAI